MQITMENIDPRLALGKEFEVEFEVFFKHA